MKKCINTVLTRDSKEDVVEAVKETIVKASICGGHIITSSNSIYPEVKPENYKAMVKAARNFGKYPLDEDLLNKYRNKNYTEKFLK